MVTLQPARVEDAEAISALMERVIVASVDASPAEKAAFIANTRKNVAMWLARPDQSFHVTAQAGGNLVGVLMARDFWNLCHLFVAPEHQGRGVGRLLVDAAVEACSGRSPRGYLRLNASRNAVGFYRHMGFSEVPGAPLPSRGMQFERAL